MIKVVVWIAFVVHLLVGGLALRRTSGVGLLPLLNLATAGCVLAYWMTRWYSYIFHGIIWYATDQLMPLYALLVCVLSVLALTGRYDGTWPHWIAFVVHTLVLVAALFFFTFVRFNRMI